MNPAALSPDELEALQHWTHFGQRGAAASERYVPDADERERMHSFAVPESAAWSYSLDPVQTLALLRGFPRGEMEDKWIVYSDDPQADGTTSVHFHRSWTGAEIVRVRLQLDDTTSMVTLGTWETDPEILKQPTEAFARESFETACEWVLGVARPVARS